MRAISTVAVDPVPISDVTVNASTEPAKDGVSPRGEVTASCVGATGTGVTLNDPRGTGVGVTLEPA